MLNKANNFIFLAKSFGSSKIIRTFANVNNNNTI